MYSFVYLIFTAAVSSQSIHEVPWLPCQFIDEHVELNEEGHRETKYIHRDAGLQFGQLGDSLVHSELITFLVTGERLFNIQLPSLNAYAMPTDTNLSVGLSI